MGWWPLQGAPALGQGGGGADSGQAANPTGFLDSITGAIADGITGAAQDANEAATEWAGAAKEKVATRLGESLPGFGSIWTIDGGGVQVTQTGKLLGVGLLIGAAFLMLGGGKRGRWR